MDDICKRAAAVNRKRAKNNNITCVGHTFQCTHHSLTARLQIARTAMGCLQSAQESTRCYACRGADIATISDWEAAFAADLHAVFLVSGSDQSPVLPRVLSRIIASFLQPSFDELLQPNGFGTRGLTTIPQACTDSDGKVDYEFHWTRDVPPPELWRPIETDIRHTNETETLITADQFVFNEFMPRVSFRVLSTGGFEAASVDGRDAVGAAIHQLIAAATAAVPDADGAPPNACAFEVLHRTRGEYECGIYAGKNIRRESWTRYDSFWLFPYYAVTPSRGARANAATGRPIQVVPPANSPWPLHFTFSAREIPPQYYHAGTEGAVGRRATQ